MGFIKLGGLIKLILSECIQAKKSVNEILRDSVVIYEYCDVWRHFGPTGTEILNWTLQ